MLKYLKTTGLIAILATSVSVQAADWELVGLKYHNYCPPTAIKNGICSTGEDFDATQFLVRPREVDGLLVNQLDYTEKGIQFGSLIVMPAPTKSNPNQKQREMLAEVIPGSNVLDGINSGEWAVTNWLSREFVIDVAREDCRCKLELHGVFTDPTAFPPFNGNPLHEATMSFVNTNCE